MLGYNDHAEVRFCRDRPLYAAAAAFAENRIIYRGVAQLVARLLWEYGIKSDASAETDRTSA